MSTTRTSSLGQRLAAETIGTLVLVLVGCGTAVLSGGDLLTTAAAFGLAVGIMITALGRVSGGHFNPAVSVGAALAGRISWLHAAAYAVTQVLGAIVGAAVLFLVLQGIGGYDHGDPIGANAFGDAAARGTLAREVSVWGALVVEIVLTLLFVLVVLAVTDKRQESASLAPLAIGGALTAVHLIGIDLTGTSVNPARSIGPALFAGSWDPFLQLWVFILAPTLGALIAAGLYLAVFGSDGDPVPGSGVNFGPPRGAVPGAYPQQPWPQQPPQAPHQAPQAPQQPQAWPAPPQQPGGWQTPPPAPQPPPQQPPGGWDDEDGRTQIRPDQT